MKRREFLKTGTVAVAGLGAIRQAHAATGSLHAGFSGTAQDEPPYRLPSGPTDPKRPLAVEPKTAPTTRITAMTRDERVRRGLVPPRGFCSTAPGRPFQETLLSGNGYIYLEHTGDPYSERVLFHHERLLLPWKRPFEAPEVADALPEIRRLLLAGKYRDGLNYAYQKLADAGLPMNTKRHATIAAYSMQIDIPAEPAANEYLRTVDFETGETRVTWHDSRGEWFRHAFVSRPDNVAVQLLTAPANQPVNVTISLQKPSVPKVDGTVQFLQRTRPDRILFTGKFDPAINENGYASVTRIVRDGGTARVDGDKVVIENARSVMLLTRIDWFDVFDQGDVDALARGVDRVVPDYRALLARNGKRQSEIMKRVSVDFGGASQHGMSVEELLEDQRTRSGYSPALLEKVFDMGRYWMLLSSGKYPIQPLAGEININVNLQISPAAMGDLPEVMLPYCDWIEGLLPDCRKNAENVFGARGVLFPIYPDKDMGAVHLYAAAENAGIWPHPYWISGGGWCYSPLWDHYLVTGDVEFLRKRVVPGLRELALFYEDYLKVEDKAGNYVFVPSFSPENYPVGAEPLPTPVWPLTVYEGFTMTPPTPLVINSAMDVMVCREVMTHLIEASEILGTDRESVPKWKAMLDKMPPYLTTSDGTLKEWGWPGLEENYDQRHVSHLYGAWPGDEIDPGRTPELAKAALLADRKRGPSNSSAHGLCHRALAGARLKDNYLVDFELKQLLDQGYFNAALRSAHNPHRGPMPDAQGGVPSILMEMLCYSRPGVIELLPALPPTLPKGSISGMRARTFARIDTLRWDLDERVAELVITSQRTQDITLVAWNGIERVSAPGGVLLESPTVGSNSCKLRLPEKKQVRIRIDLSSRNPLNWVNGTRSS